MPIVEGVAFSDATPKDVIDLFLWSAKCDVKPILRITMDDGQVIRGRLATTRPPGSNPTLYQPGIYTGTRNSTGFIPVETEKIARIEHNNKQNGGVLYDGIPFEAVLATSLSLQQIEIELNRKETNANHP